MNKNEWLMWRDKGLGGSDAAAVLGLSPYMTNVELWEDKALGIKKEFKNTEVLERGQKAEPLIRELFKLDHPEYEVFNDSEFYIHPEYNFLRGSIDGCIIDKNKKRGVLEIKHVQINNLAQKLKWKNGIPDNYFCQVLHYMFVGNFDFAILKARFKEIFADKIHISEKEYFFDKEKCREEIKYLIEKEIDFWNDYVITGVKPVLILPSI